MPDCSLIARGELQLITHPEWACDGVDMAFSTRMGGVSRGVYASLNLGLHVGDDPALVLENRARIMAVFGRSLGEAVCCEQVHGYKVARVGSADRGRGALDLESAIPGCDALVTDEPGVYLMSFYADCFPVYFYDPQHRAIGLAHCGWKGTMGRIAAHTLNAMQEAYGTVTAQVEVFIGPGIGPSCFIIQPDLKDKVEVELSELHDIITEAENGTITWDLPETNRQILLQAGVRAEHIKVCSICTACNTDRFYSYRREVGLTGRMAALLGLKY